MVQSDVARVRQQIANEYFAAQLGLSGLAEGTSRHQVITARTERIGMLHHQLEELVGDQAIVLVAQTLEEVPEQATRQDLVHLLLHEREDSAETQHLLDYTRDLWETRDLLTKRFGPEVTRKIIEAPVSVSITEVIC